MLKVIRDSGILRLKDRVVCPLLKGFPIWIQSQCPKCPNYKGIELGYGGLYVDCLAEKKKRRKKK